MTTFTAMPKYEVYKDSGVDWLGEVPVDWELVALNRTVVNCVNGLWGNEPNNLNDIVVLRVADFDRNKLKVDDGKLTLRSIPVKDRNGRVLKKGDLLIEKSGGGDKTLVGCVVLFDKDYEAVTSNFVAKMTPKNNFESRFLCYVFSFLYSSDINYRSIKQTTGIQNLDSSAYLLEVAAFPSLKVQTAIANFLDEKTTKIDEAIAIKEKQIELLKERKQIIIQQAVTQGLDPTVPMKDSGVEWIGMIPADWEVKKIKFLSKVFRGKFTHRPRNDPALYDGEYPFFQTGDVARANKYLSDYKQTLNAKGLRVSTLIPKGTIVITIAANIGDVAILDIDACFPDSVVGFAPSDEMNRDFLYFSLMNMKQKFIETSIKNTQMNLNVERIGSQYICQPPLDEQIKIMNYLELIQAEIDSGINLIYSQIEKYKEYKTTLINSAVTGKIKVV